MRLLVLAAAACGSLFATAASAQGFFGSDRYVSIGGGATGDGEYHLDYPENAGRQTIAQESGTIGQLAFGSRTGAWRLEGAVSLRKQDTVSTYAFRSTIIPPSTREGEVEIRTFDLNAYYDLPIAGPVRPYVGGGLGVASASLEDPITDGDEGSALHLQAMAGVSLEISPRAALFAEGRLQRTGDIQVETQITRNGEVTARRDEEIAISNSAVLVGVRFGF
jgi:opacity protein-like surface antigen